MANQRVLSQQPVAVRRRAGFTLLEVMLALALSAILLGAVGVAVQIHLRAVESGRVEIEQAQIARAVLDRIADDLRGALQHTAVDTSQLKLMAAASAAVKGNTDALAAAAGAAGLDTSGTTGGSTGGSPTGSSGSSTNGSSAGGGSSTSGQNSGQSAAGSSKGSSGTGGSSSSRGAATGGASTGGASSAAPTGSSNANPTGSSNSSSSGSTTTDGTGTPVPVPGIYGSEYQVQVDVSRLPRPDEYGGVVAAAASSNAAAAAGVPVSVPHDVRTVTYYLNTQAQAASNLADSSGGLMRRELHRSAALWGAQQGVDPTYDAHSVSLAPEVTALEFRYLDGAEWVSEWDTAANGCLPAAIEVAVTIGIPVASTANTITSSLTPTEGAGRQAASELVVRRVIYLPGAGKPSSTAASGSGSSATGDASATGGSTTN